MGISDDRVALRARIEAGLADDTVATLQAMGGALATMREVMADLDWALTEAAAHRAQVALADLARVVAKGDDEPRRSEPASADARRKQAIANAANSVAASSSRGGAPALSRRSIRETLLSWCLWCDPNGLYTDEANALEGNDPVGEEEAWALVESLADPDPPF